MKLHFLTVHPLFSDVDRKTKRKEQDNLLTDSSVEGSMGHTRTDNSNTGMTFRKKSFVATSI